MPFLPHFGLKSYPFGLTPNTELFYPSTDARTLLAGLEFAIQRGDGLLKVVGEVGTGKTMVARLLIERLKDLGCNVAYLNVPMMELRQVPVHVARAFGLRPSKSMDGLQQLHKFLREQYTKKNKCVLIVDEAQTLGTEGLEAIRLLSNLETDKDKLLQVVLFGQKELDELLHQSDLRQMAQRVQFAFMTQPMPTDIAEDYVRFRLEHCLEPTANRVVFSRPALRLLAKASRGVPRLLHLLADKALMAAYADGKPSIQRRHVRIAARETPDVKLARWWLFV